MCVFNPLPLLMQEMSTRMSLSHCLWLLVCHMCHILLHVDSSLVGYGAEEIRDESKREGCAPW